jgi:hypothetical protein
MPATADPSIPPRPRPAAIGAGALALLLGGCLNPSTTLTHAGKDPVPDLAPAAQEDLATPAHAPRPVPAGEPETPTPPASRNAAVAVDLEGRPVTTMPARSVTGLDRSGWQEQVVLQPRGQVEVQPGYFHLFEGFGTDPRVTGAYPTTASALGVRQNTTALQEGLAQPPMGIFWLLVAPGAAVVQPPWTTVRAPDREVEWLPASAAPAPNAAPAPSAAPAPASAPPATPTTP